MRTQASIMTATAAGMLLAATAFAAERAVTLPHRGKRQAVVNEGAVKTTLGPKGRNALTGQSAQPPVNPPAQSSTVVDDQGQKDKDKPRPRPVSGH